MKLDPHDRAILSVLDTVDAYTTGKIAKLILPIEGMFGHNMRTHSGATRAWLNQLREHGLVELADNEKPAIWRRTSAGTAALSTSKDGND